MDRFEGRHHKNPHAPGAEQVRERQAYRPGANDDDVRFWGHPWAAPAASRLGKHGVFSAFGLCCM